MKLVERKGELLKRGERVQLIGLPQTRVLVTKWVGDAWEDLCTNHKDLLKSSWRGSKLTLKLDGTEDGFD